MGLLDSKRVPDDFLLPFLRLPGVAMVCGFTSTDGAVFNSEDIGARVLTNNNGVRCASTKRAAFGSFVGASSQYLSAADAAWNSPTKDLTIMAVIAATPATTMRIVSKEPGGTNRAYELMYDASTSTTLQFAISENGTALTPVSLANGTNTTGWNFVCGRFTAGASIALWGNGLVTSSSTSAAAIYNSTTELAIGRRANVTTASNYFTGNIALVALCHAAVATDMIAELRAHCVRFGMASA